MHPTIPAVPSHSQNDDVRITPTPAPLPPREAFPPSRLAFSTADAAATLTFTKVAFPPTNAAEAVEHARQLAQALASPQDGESCRTRTLARRIAITKAQAEHLDVLLGKAVAQRDFAGARENQPPAHWRHQAAHDADRADCSPGQLPCGRCLGEHSERAGALTHGPLQRPADTLEHPPDQGNVHAPCFRSDEIGAPGAGHPRC